MGAACRRGSRSFYADKRGWGAAAGLVGRGDGAFFKILQNPACGDGAAACDGRLRALFEVQRAAAARLAARSGAGGAALLPEGDGELAHRRAGCGGTGGGGLPGEDAKRGGSSCRFKVACFKFTGGGRRSCGGLVGKVFPDDEGATLCAADGGDVPGLATALPELGGGKMFKSSSSYSSSSSLKVRGGVRGGVGFKHASIKNQRFPRLLQSSGGQGCTVKDCARERSRTRLWPVP